MLFHLFLFLFFNHSGITWQEKRSPVRISYQHYFFLFNVSLIFFDFIGTIWTYQTTIAPIK